jgi:hypothetical protein
MSLGIDLRSGDIDFSISIYPDTFSGMLKFQRDSNDLIVSADGSYHLEFGKFEQESISFPCSIFATSVTDDDAESYYFNDNGLEIGGITQGI